MILIYSIFVGYVVWDALKYFYYMRIKKFRRLTYTDFNLVVANRVYAIKATHGARDAMIFFNDSGIEFFRAIEKIVKKNREFVDFVSKLDKDSDEYKKNVQSELTVITVLIELSAAVCQQCTERIQREACRGPAYSYDCDKSLVMQYCTVADSIYSQYKRLMQEQYIPPEIGDQVKMIYSLYFNLFELINSHIYIQ